MSHFVPNGRIFLMNNRFLTFIVIISLSEKVNIFPVFSCARGVFIHGALMSNWGGALFVVAQYTAQSKGVPIGSKGSSASPQCDVISYLH